MLSRADAMVKENHPEQQNALIIAEVFTRQARRRLRRNVRGMVINEDKAVEALAQSVLERGALGWDVI